MPRILTTVVGSYPVPSWLPQARSREALRDATLAEQILKLLAESNKALGQNDLREVARLPMKKLTEATGLTSVLAVQDGDQLVWDYGPMFTARLERIS